MYNVHESILLSHLEQSRGKLCSFTDDRHFTSEEKKMQISRQVQFYKNLLIQPSTSPSFLKQ